MLTKLNKITSWQAALIIAIIGFAAYFTGLHSPFIGDDYYQIVNNVPVHSITNIRLFFEGGTFYNGGGLTPLTGTYYRPLMAIVFSLLYTLFGPQPLYFHLFQLLLCIGSTIILYLFFRYSFKPGLALFLSLVFLVHPIDSQVVFAIANMQDVLFFFFGILALWLLLWFSSAKSLALVAACLLLSLLSKETGILFVAMALLYLFWWDRKRLLPFIGSMVLPTALYTVLRVHAIGWFIQSSGAPIDSLSLAGRLLTAPSIALLYITKFVFPLKLATAYYWVNPSFSFLHVLLPLLLDLALVALVVRLAFLMRRKASKAQYYTYLFLSIWTGLGLLTTIQIIPLDFTASEPWFYFSMAGVLGVLGVVSTVFPLRVRPGWIVMAVGVLIVATFGVRTALRGLDWSNPISLDYEDIAASSSEFGAYFGLATFYENQGNFSKAKAYAQKSINIYPNSTAYYDLGIALGHLGDYPGAMTAYENALEHHGSFNYVYENLGALTLVYGSYDADKLLLLQSLNNFPQDSQLWTYLAILEDKNNNNTDAKIAISNAAKYGHVPQVLYDNIINNTPFTLELTNLGTSIKVQ